MRAVILNGQVVGDREMTRVAEALETTLRASGWDVTHWRLANEKLRYCVGCFECWVKTPGQCKIDDTNRDIAADVVQHDLLIFLTPVTFGGYSSELKKAVDHLIQNISPFFRQWHGEIHHQPRYDRYAHLRVVGVVNGPDAEAEAIFRELSARNALNLFPPTHSTLMVTRGQDARAMAQQMRAMLPTAEEVVYVG